MRRLQCSINVRLDQSSFVSSTLRRPRLAVPLLALLACGANSPPPHAGGVDAGAPCTADVDCARLNVDPCAGTFTCDPAAKVCVRGAAPCPGRPGATTTCAAPSGTPVCSWVCEAGWVDVNGDLETSPQSGSNGCECHATSASDRPDLRFEDVNCDGVDGEAESAVFVDGAAGADENAGTRAAPMRTIQAALAAAASTGRRDVYVSQGTYAESLVLADGVSIFGGYDAAAAWNRDARNTTIVASPASTAVSGAGLAAPLELQLLQIRAADAASPGESSYGVRIDGSTGIVTVRACDIASGVGAAGNDGNVGTAGLGGVPGGSASFITSPGFGGASPCGAQGGSGGPGVSGVSPGVAGSQGVRVMGGGAAAAGGAGGSSGSCSTTSSSNGGSAPPVVFNGGPGSAGEAGVAAASVGTFAGGSYVPASGGTGVAGTPGGGGGGGGSGGGTANATDFFCTNCSSLSSGAGGGGGGGGCGGGPGAGGRGGGGSFAIVALDATLIVETSQLASGRGGAGGRGGPGGVGGSGGPPGSGAAGQTRTSCSTRIAGSGAAGSSGGAGGVGGGGAGGSGGPSVCIAHRGSLTLETTTCAAGPGGSGGAGGSPTAPPGSNGASATTLVIP